MRDLYSVPDTLGERRIRVLSAKYDGRLNYQWDALVLHETAEGFIWFTPGGAPFVRPTHTHPTSWDWIGVFWYDRWYSVTASLLPPHTSGDPGVLHHYYCNIGTPGVWHDETFRYVDLDLDVLIDADGHQDVLDVDEFALHRERFGYPADVVACAEAAVRDVAALAQAGAPPFEGLLAAYHGALFGEHPTSGGRMVHADR